MNDNQKTGLNFAVTLVIILLIGNIFQSLRISRLQGQVHDLALTVEAFVSVQTDLNEYFAEGTDEIMWDMFDSLWNGIHQNALDDAWHRCRIAHDLNILFGGNVAVEGRLNYNCVNQFYLDEKPTVKEFLGED